MKTISSATYPPEFETKGTAVGRAGVGCTFVVQILIIQFASAFFGMAPLDLALWLKLFGVASSVVAFSELINGCTVN